MRGQSINDTIGDLCAEILDIAQLDASLSFIDLGGDSIAAMRFISRIGSLFRLDVAIRDVFEAASLDELSARIGELVEEDQDKLSLMDQMIGGTFE